jgi:aryl-alcohol dehydrogenase-like predicted oxidoreductase
MTSAIMKDAPRFTEHWDHNKKLVEKFKVLAEKKGCSPSQLAIAWVSAQGAIPIPGTKSIGRLEENFGAAKVDLSEEELREIRDLIKDAGTKGDRYAPVHMAMVGR